MQPHIAWRQTIAQPVDGAAHELDVLACETHFFLQLPEYRLLGLFAAPHSTLRKLPAPSTHATTQENLPRAAHQHDADVGAKAFRIDDVAHGSESATSNVRRDVANHASGSWFGNNATRGRICCF